MTTQERELLVDALRHIMMNLSLSVPLGCDPESHYRGQLCEAIGTAARALAALPSEGNRERSERTAAGDRLHLACAVYTTENSTGQLCDIAGMRATLNAVIGDIVMISRESLKELYDAIARGDEEGLAIHAPAMLEAARVLSASSPASASMSAGVTDAMVQAALTAYNKAPFNPRTDMDPYANAMRLAVEAAERARANTRAGDDLLPRLTPVAWNESTAGDAKGAG